MQKNRLYSYSILLGILFLIWKFSNQPKVEEDFSERVRLSLREVGHELLLENKDTTSLVLPIIDIEALKYKLAFQKQLSIIPEDLVAIVKKSLENSNLPKKYRVEVKQCMLEKVVYSYEIKKTENKSIIPCMARELPVECYTIDVKFINKNSAGYNVFIYLIIIALIFSLFIEIYLYKKSKPTNETPIEEPYIKIGHFQFFPEQNKLIKEATEIGLSKKECELLAIFVAAPNQIIKRDELTKRVWEDHGVFVGRSLDTYISKLRKKLKTDDTLKISNVHGVGYKLEIIN